jgi:NitT/TauT family transport system permease protein
MRSDLHVVQGLGWRGCCACCCCGGGCASVRRPTACRRAFHPWPAWRAVAAGELYGHIWVSLKRILVGLLLALLIGVPLGLLVGSYRHLEAATTPAFQFLRMISPLSWMPVVVMLMGVGDQPIYFLLAFAALWPILLNTAAGVRQLDPRWLQLSRSLSATRWETLCKVILPGVIGHVLTGVRLAIGILWIVLVPCEMLGVSAGLGYFILDTRDRLAYSELMAMVLLIGVLGFALDALARGLHRRWVHA